VNHPESLCRCGLFQIHFSLCLKKEEKKTNTAFIRNCTGFLLFYTKAETLELLEE